jgi:hypothetical protein
LPVFRGKAPAGATEIHLLPKTDAARLWGKLPDETSFTEGSEPSGPSYLNKLALSRKLTCQ